MAKKAIIPIVITSPLPDDECTAYYSVRYRLQGEPGWTDLPNTTDTTIEITNLVAATDYDLEITRHCCSGLVSAPLITTFTTDA